MSKQRITLAQHDEPSQQQNQELLARLNAAYAEELTSEERVLLRESQTGYARLLEEEW